MRFFALGPALLSLALAPAALAANPLGADDAEPIGAPPAASYQTETTTVTQEAPPPASPTAASHDPSPAPPEMIRMAHGSRSAANLFPGYRDGDQIAFCSEARDPAVWVATERQGAYCLWTLRRQTAVTRTYAAVQAPSQPTWEQRQRPNPRCGDAPRSVNYALVQPTAAGGVEACTRRANPTGTQVLFGLLGMGIAGYAIHEGYGYYGDAYRVRGPYLSGGSRGGLPRTGY